MNVQVIPWRTYAVRVTSSAEPRWLTPGELQTWKALHLVLMTLPTALGNQLQCDSNLSLIEYYVLAGLSDQPDHTMRLSSLAILANSELSRLSHMVGRLERRGLVRREIDPTDGRYTRAILTQKGNEELVQAAPGHVAQVRQLIFQALSADEQHALRSAMMKIMTQLTGEC